MLSATAVHLSQRAGDLAERDPALYDGDLVEDIGEATEGVDRRDVDHGSGERGGWQAFYEEAMLGQQIAKAVHPSPRVLAPTARPDRERDSRRNTIDAIEVQRGLVAEQ